MLRKLATADRGRKRGCTRCVRWMGLGAIEISDIEAGLRDDHPGVRRHAVRLCEALKDPGELRAELGRCIADDDPHVRLQLAYALGQLRTEWAGQFLATLGRHNAQNPYISAAVLSSINEHTLVPLAASLAERPSRLPVQLESVLRISLAQGNGSAAATLIGAIARRSGEMYGDWQFEAAARAGAILDGDVVMKLAASEPAPAKQSRNSLALWRGEEGGGR